MVRVPTDLSLSLTGDSDIPEDAELAETFYSQFEDEFEDDEEFSSGEEEEQDYSALVGHMEDALESSGSWGPGAGTLPEETISEGMSGSLRQHRIKGLRAYPLLQMMPHSQNPHKRTRLSDFSLC